MDKAGSDRDAFFRQGIDHFLGLGLGVRLEIVADGLGFVDFGFLAMVLVPCEKWNWKTVISQAYWMAVKGSPSMQRNRILLIAWATILI